MKIAKVKDGKMVAVKENPDGSMRVPKKLIKQGWRPLKQTMHGRGRMKAVGEPIIRPHHVEIIYKGDR